MSGEAVVLQRPAAMRFRTKQEFVYKTLRDAIMRCELVPQQRLVIEDLARELQVSASPVREALQLLQSEGLEIVATRTTAQRMTAKDTAGFDEIVTAMDEALRGGRYEEWADLNSRFHLTISRLSAMRARDLATLEQIVKQHNRGALLAYAEYLKGRSD